MTELERAMPFSNEASNKPKRQGGGMAVGLTRSRGVNEVMLIEYQEFGTLEGISNKAQKDEQRMPYIEMENITLAKSPSYLNGLGRGAMIALAGTERVAWMMYLYIVVR